MPWTLAALLATDIVLLVLVRAGLLRRHVLPQRERLIMWLTVVCVAVAFVVVGNWWVFRP